SSSSEDEECSFTAPKEQRRKKKYIPRIYTRTGDKGTSTRYFGQLPRPKSHAIFQTLGDLDELNAALGVAIVWCQEDGHHCSDSLAESGLANDLKQMQCDIMDISAAFAVNEKEEYDRKEREKEEVLLSR